MGFVDMGVGHPAYISPNLWKAYGYWARPTVNEVIVHNASMLSLSPIYEIRRSHSSRSDPQRQVRYHL